MDKKWLVPAIGLVLIAVVLGVFFLNQSEESPAKEEVKIEPVATVEATDNQDFRQNQVMTLEPQTVAPGGGIILVDAKMPFGYKLNGQAPFTAVWTKNDHARMDEALLEYKETVPQLPIQFPVVFEEGETELSVDLTIYWCEAIKETLCFIERKTVIIPLTISADSDQSEVEISYRLVPPVTP